MQLENARLARLLDPLTVMLSAMKWSRRDVRILDPLSPLDRGLEQLQPVAGPPYAALPVVADERLVGMLTLEGLGELVAIRTALASSPVRPHAATNAWTHVSRA